MEDKSTGFTMTLRLKPAMGNLLETLSAKKSVAKTTILTLALQAYAKQEGIAVPTEEKEGAAA